MAAGDGVAVGATVLVGVGVGHSAAAASTVDRPAPRWLLTNTVKASASTATKAAYVNFCFIAASSPRSTTFGCAGV